VELRAEVSRGMLDWMWEVIMGRQHWTSTWEVKVGCGSVRVKLKCEVEV
jgi:hypothetical protein